MTTATLEVSPAAPYWTGSVHPGEVAPGDDWTVGEPLRDHALRTQISAALHDVALLPGFEAIAILDEDRDFATLGSALDTAHDQLARLAGSHQVAVLAPALARYVALLSELARLRVHLAQARAAQRNARYAATRNALSRLHGVDSVEQMLERAPAELAKCGFDRVIVSRVEESTWWVENVHVRADPEWASEIARVGRENPAMIDHLLIESEIMRRRAPVLVRDAQHDPRINAAIGQASLSRSYVAAPIMPDGRIIGMLHADCYNSRRHVDEEDLAVLWMFAEGFGYAFQRTALSERLRGARDEIQRMARDIATAADDLCTARTVLGAPRLRADQNDAPPVAVSLAANSSIETLLSRREIEVVSLMAEGMSNGAIATHLVISEGTVKTHVKHVLRKLKASNRAEAVFRYMRMTAVHGTARTPRP
ncbi:LuxR C-terminal-related transcriptional regulator [Mycolicibacterium fluoranthenivorans]|uniref:GAF domain-containing protein n=1 Tax=Mycolicibacterium fluoranthenivorans TaxID=258505 RepID=A0A1G4VM84_9MYCO|nr:LuxR C-terminal-related transcriptional regulator [Mycolicibacterium fluoranthenivorans]SCX08150.1 GAF domain-containing protein [Mycolicibacterium fluoranthenivorans]